MTPAVLQSWFDLFITVAAAVGLVLTVIRWADRKLEKRIVKEIQESTKQIATDSNGGQSLNDLHKKVDSLAEDMLVLKRAVIRLEDDVEGLMEDE